MLRRRADLSSRLRTRRALRVALGQRKWLFRPLDRRGRYPLFVRTFPRYARTEAEAIGLCGRWLDRMDSRFDSWWFHISELAFDSSGKYPVVVSSKDVLVYRETLWTGYRPPFVTSDRKAVLCG